MSLVHFSPTKLTRMSLLPMYSTGPSRSHPSQMYHLKTISRGVQIITFLTTQIFSSLFCFSLFDRSIFLSTLFLEYAQPTSCFNVTDQVSHLYTSKTTGETTYRISLPDVLQACWRIPLIISTPKARNCQRFLQRTTHRPAHRPYVTLS